MNKKFIKSLLTLLIAMGVTFSINSKALAVSDPGDPPSPIAPISITSTDLDVITMGSGDPGDPPRP